MSKQIPWPLAFLLLALLFSTSAAPQAFWQEVGPDGGEVVSFLVDPSDPQRLYAGTVARGLFTSADGGDNWRLTGIRSGASVGAVAVGSDPARIYAGQGEAVWVSTDGGATWTATPFIAFSAVQALAVDGNVVYAGGFAGLFRLDPGGWTRIGVQEISAGFAIFDLHLGADGTLFVATAQGLFATTDRGASFQRLGAGILRGALRVVEDPTSSAILVSAIEPHAIFLSNPARSQWTNVSTGLPGTLVSRAFEVESQGSRRYLLALSDQGLHRSELPGGAWTRISDQPFTSFRADRLVAAGDAVGTLFAPGPAGVARSLDGGTTWALASNGLRALELDDYAAVGTDRDGMIYASSGNGSVFGRNNRDGAWNLLAQARFSVETPLAIDPTDPETIYRGVSGRVERSTNGGATWQSSELLECNEIDVLAVAPSRPETLYAAGYTLTAGCSLEFPDACFTHRSTDGGLTWSCTEPLGLVRRFLVDPRDDLRVYALEFERLLRSDDGGDHWQELRLDPETSFVDLALDPLDPDLVYLVSGDRIERSTDMGHSWSTLTAPPPTLVALVVHPREPRNLYALASGGLYASPDSGASWRLLQAATTDLTLRGPLVVPVEEPRRLYAGTTGAGLVTRLIPVRSECVRGPETLCLAGGRFEVEVAWRDFRDRRGAGRSVELTGDTGAFWFFRNSNLELMVKILDGRPVNGRWWVFFGSLSNVEFDLRVTDTETGVERVYRNPLGTFASRGDTAAFPGDPLAALDGAGAADQGPVVVPGEEVAETLASAFSGVLELPAQVADAASRSLGEGEGSTCVPDATTLCLRDRFRLRIRWQDFQDRSGDGKVQELTPDTGAFWFFRPGNLELMVKVLDGRPVNGHWWVFFGSLTNVAFTLTVEDLVAGTEKVYFNPARIFVSRGDTGAF